MTTCRRRGCPSVRCRSLCGLEPDQCADPVEDGRRHSPPGRSRIARPLPTTPSRRARWIRRLTQSASHVLLRLGCTLMQMCSVQAPLRMVRTGVVVATVALVVVAPPSGQQPAQNKQQVKFKSGQLTLVGVVYKPDGSGSFPTVIWNHGSEKMPGSSRQFDAVSDIFVPAGYAVFAPSRRGHDSSEGAYISDLM